MFEAVIWTSIAFIFAIVLTEIYAHVALKDNPYFPPLNQKIILWIGISGIVIVAVLTILTFVL